MSLKHDAAEVVSGQSSLERDNASQCFSPSWWHEECKHILQWAEEALSSCILAFSIMLARIANQPWSACVRTVSLFQLHRICHRNQGLPGRTFVTQGGEWQTERHKKKKTLQSFAKNKRDGFFFFGETELWLSFWVKGECINHRPAIFFRSIKISFPCALVTGVLTDRGWT